MNARTVVPEPSQRRTPEERLRHPASSARDVAHQRSATP